MAKKILLVTDTWYRALGPLAGRASLAMSYLSALGKLGHEVELVDLCANVYKYRWLRGKPLRTLKTLMIAAEAGPLIRQHALASRPDLAMVIRGNYLSLDVLQRIKKELGLLMFHFHPDDFFNPDNTSPLLHACIPAYDCMFTPKSFNVSELREAGARRVKHLPHGYDPEIHRPVPVTEEEKVYYGSDVVFIGDWRKAREEVLLEALTLYGLKIWGNSWHKVRRGSPLREHLAGRPAYCHEMARVIGASKIAIGLLNVENRDLSSGRSYEIPACGGFLLAQRTSEHLELYVEGKEIECFDGISELRAKIDYYLEHDGERLEIAAAGHRKVWEMPWSYVDRMRRVLEVFEEMR